MKSRVVPVVLLGLCAASIGVDAQQDSPEVRQLTDRADALGAQPVGGGRWLEAYRGG